MNANAGSNVWDPVYAAGGYREAPDADLISLCASLVPGTALDAGAGDGRHALWLATQGWNVEAFDVSSEGIAALRRGTQARGLTVRSSVQSIAAYDFKPDAYDLVTCTGCPLNFFRKSGAKQLLGKLKAAVRPGGHLYVTLSTVEDPAYQRRRAQAAAVEDDSFWSDKTKSWLNAFQPGELRECLADWQVVSYAERVVHDTHGTPHDHVMAFVAARRPDTDGGNRGGV